MRQSISFVMQTTWPPTAERQVAALLTGRALNLVRERYGDAPLTGDEYRFVFTVGIDDVVQYVRAHGFPKGAIATRPGRQDGAYFIEERGEHVVFYQEREIRFDEERYGKREDAVPSAVALVLNVKGTATYVRA